MFFFSEDNVSATDVNVDENGESVPGFILVNMPATNKIKPKDNGKNSFNLICVRLYFKLDLSS